MVNIGKIRMVHEWKKIVSKKIVSSEVVKNPKLFTGISASPKGKVFLTQSCSF